MLGMGEQKELVLCRLDTFRWIRLGASLKMVTRGVPEPKAGEVRVRVEACGVCHSDSATSPVCFLSLAIPASPDMR
jgi:hypothetical protein